MDAANLALQTLQSSAAKALKGLSLAREYMHYGFTSLRDLGSVDPARVTWFDDEMEALTSTAHQLGMPVAVHTGAAEGCKQAIRFGVRSLEHAYLIDAEGIEMAEPARSYIVPTMQMTQQDLHELQTGTCHVRRCGNFGATMKGSSHPSGCWPEAG